MIRHSTYPSPEDFTDEEDFYESYYAGYNSDEEDEEDEEDGPPPNYFCRACDTEKFINEHQTRTRTWCDSCGDVKKHKRLDK